MILETTLTAEQFKEWKSHPVTEEVFRLLLQHRAKWEAKSLLYPSMEQTFRATVEREGVLQGLDALLGMDVED
jgi:hypothetical protein